jgi:hypothetical protein
VDNKPFSQRGKWLDKVTDYPCFKGMKIHALKYLIA